MVVISKVGITTCFSAIALTPTGRMRYAKAVLVGWEEATCIEDVFPPPSPLRCGAPARVLASS